MRTLSRYLTLLPLAHLLSGCIIIGPGDSASGSGTDATSGTTDATAGTDGTTAGTEGSASASGTGTGGSTGAQPTTSAGTGETTGGATGTPSSFGEACAPDDGPATEFQIGIALRACDSTFPDDAPIFRIVVYQGLPLAVGEHKLDGGLGFAYLDTGNGMPVTGDVGTLVVTAVTADGLLGTYDVTLTDSTHLTGDFDALYCPVDVVCG